ncbi:hypothetical protein KCG44_01865 [Pacificimonas sp. WHA3]|uniref:Uncharacterized protein n=1 Tax=Pacificimonas pallii TaxID=2827236 RepID=A0ABS6SC92_9SPHN|nr:hypothetical protein [Pacificimonas pallii]MBV7255526.1 hypothetical protein [Pacificimonas pallii]
MTNWSDVFEIIDTDAAGGPISFRPLHRNYLEGMLSAIEAAPFGSEVLSDIKNRSIGIAGTLYLIYAAINAARRGAAII